MNASRPLSASAILHAMVNPPSPTDDHQRDERSELMELVLALHRSNRKQWDREDDVRRHNSSDAMVASAKRDIDQLNSTRHGLIEAIDQAVTCATHLRDEAPLVTESPGMAIDRLSVLVLRFASTEHRATPGQPDAGAYARRLPRLRHQIDQLERAIATLLSDLESGNRRFIAHEGLKLYGPGDSGRIG